MLDWFPDETVVPGESSPVQDDYRSYHMLKRIASSLDIQVVVAYESSHKLVDILGSTGPS